MGSQKAYERRVAIIIATFGEIEWEVRGNEAADQVLDTQTVRPWVIRKHFTNATLTEVRNHAVKLVNKNELYDGVEWLVFLDADDELEEGFVEALEAYDGPADILQTAVRGFQDLSRDMTGFNVYDPDGPGLEVVRHWLEPVPVLRQQMFPLNRQNYLTIGSPIQREMFNKVGGFDEWPVLEDWALWLKCYYAGAKFDELYDAIYHINDDHQRNRHPDIDDIARQIRVTYK